MFMAVLLLVVDLEAGLGHGFDQTEDQACTGAGDTNEHWVALQVQAAEDEISRLTDQAVLAMLHEVRAWKPGDKR